MSKDEEQNPKGEYGGSSEKSDNSSGNWEREVMAYQDNIGDGSVKEGYQPKTTVDTTRPPAGDDED